MNSVADFLRAHDEELRTGAELDDAAGVTQIGPLWLGRFGSRGHVTYRDLTGHDADELIRAAIEHFAADPDVTAFEWKTRGHDTTSGLPRRLLAAGFTAEPTETVMIGAASALATEPVLPAGVVLCRAGDGTDLAADVAAAGRLHRSVFPGHTPDRDAHLLATLVGAGDRNQLWLVEADGRAVCTGRLARVAGTRFAGLFGGATDPVWRHQGLYRALTAARAGSALRMGASLVYAECTEFSRPILERAGLLAVTTTTPWLWRRG